MKMTQSEHRSDPGLATALRISVRRLARRLRFERSAPGLGEPDLSETQLAAVATLERHGAMTPGELAEHEKVQPPSMTRVLSVPEAGRDLVIKARRRREAWLAQRLKELSPAERATLRAAAPILEKLSQA